MPLHRWRIGACLASLIALTIAVATPAHALRVATWNIARYQGSVPLQPALRTVVAGMNADVIILQELNSATGRNEFLNNVLNNVQPGQWAATNWIQLSGSPIEGGAIFYKTAKVSVGTPALIATSGPRDVLWATLQLVGYNAASASFRLYSVHLKAGEGGTDSSTRRLECTEIRTALNALPAGTNFILGGDFNFYGGWEYGYIRLTESTNDNDGRFKDPLNLPGNWSSNSGYAVYHTQSPCDVGDCPSGFTTGGMDDRFDLLLTSLGIQNSEGLDYVADFDLANGALPYTYGNDGQHYNLAINAGGFNSAVGITIANALHAAADHLPVIMTLQVPAEVVANSQLDFGSAIVGGTAEQTITVANGATAPADELDYTFSAPAGFTAPVGGFALETFDGPFPSQIGMDTATPGVKTGTMTLTTDDPDSLSKPVKLSGTVLRHAVASLDSSAISASTLVDFGDYAIGYFSDQMLRVHNQGFDALQARLSQSAANITGGDGRFSIVGGFSPTLVGSPAKTWNIHFADAGATLDATYTATLTFTNADEPLPGATAAADLTITLRAKPVSTTTGVPGRDLPKALAFYPPHPNPLHRETLFAFDLPQAAPVSLVIYDLSGRRVANLVAGTQEADRHQVRWDARTEGGQPVPAGLYFARFSTPGLTRLTRLIVLP